jgi:hypothetical protein
VGVFSGARPTRRRNGARLRGSSADYHRDDHGEDEYGGDGADIADAKGHAYAYDYGGGHADDDYTSDHHGWPSYERRHDDDRDSVALGRRPVLPIASSTGWGRAGAS